MKLTERDLAPSVGPQDFMHVVVVNDHTQNPDGSSYKARIQQVLDLMSFTGATNYIQKLDANNKLTNSSLIDDGTIISTSVSLNIGVSYESIQINQGKLTVQNKYQSLPYDIFLPYPSVEGTAIGLVSVEQLNAFDATLLHKDGDEIKTGTLTANSFIVPNGTSSGFLKADGSIDNNVYLTAVTTTFKQDIVVSLSNNKTMGKYTNGQTIPAAGKTFEQVMRDIAIEYLTPSFSSFNVGVVSPIEVGIPVSSAQTFSWGFNNVANVSANTMSIIDVNNNNNVIKSGLSIASPATITVGSITNTIPINYSWKGQATDTNSNPLTSGLATISSIYPYFYGVSTTPPVANQTLINSGTKQVIASSGNINITFGASLQYLWFAIPQSSTDKTKWYVDALNNGSIGTSTDLFNNDVIVSVNSPSALWNGVNYRIYISNYATTTSGNMQMQN